MTNRLSTPHEKPSQHKKRQAKTCRRPKYGTVGISLVPPQSIPAFAVRSPYGWPFALTLFSADLKTVFVVWRTCLQHRVNQRQQFASQSNRCTFSALPLFYPPVPTGEVQASFSGDDPSHLAEHTLQIRITFVNVSTLAFSGTLVVTGTQTAQEHICWESGKALISVPISAIMAAAAVTSMPGMEHRMLNASSCL